MLRVVLRSTAARIAGSRNCATAARAAPVTVLSEEEQMLQDTVRKVAVNVIKPLVREMDEAACMDKRVIDACFKEGLMGVSADPKYGGSGLSFLSSCIAIEELAKVDPSVSVMVDVQNTLVENLVERFGSDYIKETYLTKLTTQSVGSFCLSEPGSGSDAFALKTRAEAQGNDAYVLNGTKMWITNAGEADFFFIMANANPSAGYKGITCFAVDRNTPGLKIGKKENKLGIRASSTCEVAMVDVKVPAKNIVGELGKGYKIAIETLNEGRIGIGAQMLGLAQGAFDEGMQYLHQRKQFGSLIADFQGVQFQYAQAATDIEAAKLLVYNAARLKDAGLPFVQQAAMAKLFASQVAERVASLAVEWAGGVGFTREYPFEKFYRDAKIGSIYEGTSNLQLWTIAKALQRDYRP